MDQETPQFAPVAMHFTGLGLGKLIIGEPTKLYYTDQFDADTYVDRLTLKVPCAGFMLIEACLMANSMVIGYDEKTDESAPVDAFAYVGEGKPIDTFVIHGDGKRRQILLRRQNRITIKLDYTGLVPEGMTKGEEYPFAGRFDGRALVTGINGY